MVSVIIPTYNYGHFIRETIDSVIRQTYSDWECIVIDNGSDDNTKDVLSDYISDERIRYIYTSNEGVAAARNKGLHLAKGDLVLFLDADDLIERDKLRVSVEYFESHPGTELVYSDMRYFMNGNRSILFMNYQCDDNEQPWMSYQSGSGKNLVEKMLDGNTMVVSSPVTRMAALRAVSFFREDLSYNEDWDLWLRLLLKGSLFEFVQAAETLTLVRVHQQSASRDVFKMQVSGLRVLNENAEALAAIGLEKKFAQKKHAHIKLIRENLAASSKKDFKTKMLFLKEHGIEKEVVPFALQRNYFMNWSLKYFE